MRILVPSSCRNFKVRFSAIDIFCAVFSPLLALYVRDAYILSPNGANAVALYCGISLIFTLIAFAIFRVSDGISNYFSVHNVLSVLKAVLVSELLTCVMLFTFTRLDGIPRSTPLIHASILTAGMILTRALFSVSDVDRRNNGSSKLAASENILMIGMTRLSSIYMELLTACSPNQYRIIGILDEDSAMIGRSIGKTSVIGLPHQLEPIIDEFTVHGIRTHRIIVGGDESLLPTELIDKIRQICAQRTISLDFIPGLIGLTPLQSEEIEAEPVASAPKITQSSYFRYKRFFGFFAAAVIIVALLPLWLTTCVLVFIDVGVPVFFWQQRIGLHGRPFLLYKFRTMRPPFDWRGFPIAEDQRTSWIGYLLRETRLDELPQLLNVLVGNMDLIGPRPLLPRDQPANPTTRLMVRPGITGWAQVNGGTLLNPEEKDKLDEWYILNASPWLDFRIVAMTFRIMSGPRRQSISRHIEIAGQRQAASMKQATTGGKTVRARSRR
jgi:lipopolysaccharide/colanic/teichoic acid biosynthesis glycosyltransferase